MRVLLLSRYDRLGASSRVRSLQYLPALAAAGIEVTVSPLLDNDYLRRLYAGRNRDLTGLLAAYARRLGELLRGARYDLLWVEKEVLPWLPAWPERLLRGLGVPFVVDYDDSQWHAYELHPRRLVRALLGAKIDAVMRHATLVIAGNAYLGDHARVAGARRVELLPSVIDLDRYPPARPCGGRRPLVIGWMGSPMNATRYLEPLAPALAAVCRDGAARLVLVGSGPVPLPPDVPVTIRDWSEETEVAAIDEFDVGIMPLPDEPYSRGKCAYKLIQYMACARPVVATPVGMNNEVVASGTNGFFASTTSEWTAALAALRDQPDLARRLGAAGRAAVEARYCLQVTAPRLATLLQAAAGDRGGAAAGPPGARP